MHTWDPVWQEAGPLDISSEVPPSELLPAALPELWGFGMWSSAGVEYRPVPQASTSHSPFKWCGCGGQRTRPRERGGQIEPCLRVEEAGCEAEGLRRKREADYMKSNYSYAEKESFILTKQGQHTCNLHFDNKIAGQ